MPQQRPLLCSLASRWLTLRKSRGISEEKVVELEPERWQEQGHIDTSSEDLSSSRSNTIFQSDQVFDERRPHEDTASMASSYSGVIGSESMLGALPLRDSALGLLEPGQAQSADWCTARPTSNALQRSSTVCDKTMQTSQSHQVAFTQMLCVPVTFSMTCGAPTLPTTNMAQHPQERPFSSASHRAFAAPGVDSMATQQHAVVNPFVAGYFPQSNQLGLVASPQRALCTCSAAATNQMDLMAGGSFNVGSPTIGAMRNSPVFSDSSQGIQLQSTAYPLGNSWGGMQGSG